MSNTENENQKKVDEISNLILSYLEKNDFTLDVNNKKIDINTIIHVENFIADPAEENNDKVKFGIKNFDDLAYFDFLTEFENILGVYIDENTFIGKTIREIAKYIDTF